MKLFCFRACFIQIFGIFSEFLASSQSNVLVGLTRLSTLGSDCYYLFLVSVKALGSSRFGPEPGKPFADEKPH
jgi:hypothetical protein